MSSFYPQRYLEFLLMLRKARENAGMSQEQLAARLQLLQSQVSKGESGDRRLDPVEVVFWLRAVGVAPDEFLSALADRMASSTPVGTARAKRAKSSASSSKTGSGFRDPVSDQYWSGRGRMPAWLKVLTAGGRELEDFRVPAPKVPAAVDSKRASPAARKPASK